MKARRTGDHRDRKAASHKKDDTEEAGGKAATTPPGPTKGGGSGPGPGTPGETWTGPRPAGKERATWSGGGGPDEETGDARDGWKEEGNGETKGTRKSKGTNGHARAEGRKPGTAAQPRFRDRKAGDAPAHSGPAGRDAPKPLLPQEKTRTATPRVSDGNGQGAPGAAGARHRSKDDGDGVDKNRLAARRRYKAVLSRHIDRSDEDPDRPVTVVPPLPPSCREVEQRTTKEGLASLRVVLDEARKEHTYEVIEPTLTTREDEVLSFLRETLYRTLDGRHDPTDKRDWSRYLDRAVEEAIVDHFILIDDVSKTRIKYYLMREFLGYGPIDVLMEDPMIEDISCDGPGIPLYVFHRHFESVPTNVVFKDEDALDAFVVRLGQISGKQISLADPLLDATLPDSSRLQATLSREITTRGSSFTIRRFRSDPLTPPDLIRLGTMDARLASFFWLAMEGGKSMIYAGGTASGKTTTLNAVCQFIPPEKKIVSIEDTREINLRQENWIAGVSRAGNQDGKGASKGTIDMYRLLEAALRQRPEFLLVGEVRGVEAKTLFQAMATGHATYSTLHADSARSAVYRLENRPIDIPRIMLQTLEAVAIQVQARVGDRPVRRLKELVEVVGIHPESGDLILNTVFRWRSADDTYEYMGSSNILRAIAESRNMTMARLEGEWARRADLLDRLAAAGIRHIDTVADVIRRYYRDPEAALRWVELLVERQKATKADGTGKERAVEAVVRGGGRR